MPARMLHIGDDALADDSIPRGLGLKVRPKVRPLARSAPRARLRKADAMAAEAGRRWRRRTRVRKAPPLAYDTPEAFGRLVLGPIAAEFCTRVWAYADQAAADGEVAMLFCARGGLGIRAVYEATAKALRLPQPGRRENLHISRLVAARPAVAARGAGIAEELGREFAGARFRDVAAALGTSASDLPTSWDAPFDTAKRFDMLAAPDAEALAAEIAAQSALIRRHLEAAAGTAARVLLVDTGLHGSTQMSLGEGMPGLGTETLQFARSNYKGHGQAHFDRVSGLMVERNMHAAFDRPSVVLRYWQLIERLFEPDLPSVRCLHEAPDGSVSSNAGEISHDTLDAGAGNPLLAGVLAYVASLDKTSPSEPPAQRLMAEAEIAWARLERIVTRPRPHDVCLLGQAERGRDFGRHARVSVLAAESTATTRLGRTADSLWKEGAIAQEFPHTGPALLTALDALHRARGFSQRFR